MSLNRLVKLMVLVTIVLSSTINMRFTFVSISPFHVSLFLTFSLAVINILMVRKLTKGFHLVITTVILLSSLLSYSISNYKEWAMGFLLNDFLGIAMIFLIVNYFFDFETDKILKALIRSQYLTILCSVYFIFMYYGLGSVVNHINLLNVIEMNLSEAYLERMSFGNDLRLSFPYSTPPRLSVVMSVAIFILWTNKQLFSKSARIILLFSFLSILFFTFSRTGVLALVVVMALWKVFKIKEWFNFKSLLVASCFIVGSLIILYLYPPEVIERFQITNFTENRHLLVPIEGLIIWTSKLQYFLFGTGFGESMGLVGKYTYLPPYYLNSYVTLLAERGFLGILILFIYIYPLIYFLRKKKIKNSTVFFGFFIILVSFFVYEVRHNIFVWIYFSLVIMVIVKQDKKDMNARI